MSKKTRSKKTKSRKNSSKQAVKKQTISKQMIRTGLLNGLGVFTLGFGVMFVLWILFKNSNNLFTYLPFGISYLENDTVGFYDYKAATWGDALCLPMIVCLFTIFLLKNAFSENKKKAPRIAFVIGGLVGSAFQGFWLWDDKTQKNWSIPNKHVFNIAGWWHSIFFIIIFGLIAYFLVASWLVIKDKKTSDSADNILWGGILLSGGLFLFLHFYDDYNSTISHAYIYALTFLASAAVFGMYLLFSHFSKDLFNSILIGLLFALAVAVFICEKVDQGNWLVAMASGVIACASWKTNKISTTVSKVLLSLFSFSVIFNYACSLNVWAERLMILLPVIIVLVNTEVLSKKGNTVFFVATLFMILYILYLNIDLDGILKDAAEGALSIIVNGAVNFALFLIITIGFKLVIQTVFETIVINEEKVNAGESTLDELDTIKTITYFKIIILVVGLLALFVQWFVVLIGGNISSFYNIFTKISFVYLKPFSATILALAILWLNTKCNRKESQISKIATIIFATISGITLVVPNILFIAKEMDISRIDGNVLKGLMFIFIVFHGVGSALLLTDGYYGNTVTLRRNNPVVFSRVVSIILFLFDLLICASNALIVVFCFSFVGLIMIGINLLIICELLPALCVHTSKEEITREKDTEKKIVLTTAKQGVMQDGFSTIIAQVFLVVIPYIYIKCDRENPLFSILSLSLFVMIQGMLVVEFFIKNNNDHILNQKKNAGIDDTPLCDWFALRKRILLQQKITFYLTCPYSLIYFVLIWFKYLLDRRKEKRGTFREDFVYNYIDCSRYQDDFSSLQERYNLIQKQQQDLKANDKIDSRSDKNDL